MRSQPSRKAAAVASGLRVVAGRDRRAADLELADLAVAERVARSPGRGCAARSRASGRPSTASRRDSALPPATGAAYRSCSSATRSTVSTSMPHAEVGERHRERRLGHAEHGERRLGVEAVRRGRGAERLHRGGIDRLGAVEREPPRRQVETALAPQRARRERVREVRARGDRAAGTPRSTRATIPAHRGSRSARRARARSRRASASSAAR